MKCVNCKAELAPTDNFCGQCRQKVEKNQHDLKKCPSCNSVQKASVKYCSNCSNEMDKGIICEVNPEKSLSENSLPLKSATIENSPENSTDIDTADELDGGDKSDHQQSTELNSTVEKGDLKQAEARGVVVICTHATFVKNIASLTERQSATNDNYMMKEIWKLYDDCEVLAFEDKSSSFYDTELEEKIKEKMKEIPEIKYFVFVLSTHGEDKPEVILHDKPEGEFHDKGNLHHRHYFYTKDGQFETQKLMTKINGIDGVKGKMKLFFIQACRSRYGKKLDNVDLGSDVTVTYPKGHIPEKTTDSYINDINQTDALAAYTEYDEHFGTKQSFTENKDAEPKESVISEILPDVVLPHFEDCVVVFGSMTGKQTYRKDNSHDEGGGWMIKALHTTLDSYHKQDAVHHVHIMDILTEINIAVSKLSVSAPKDILEEMNMAKSEDYQLKAQSCFFHNLALKDEHMTLHKTKTK